MITLYIILGIIAYLVIGGIAAGVICDEWQDNIGDYMLMCIGWPIILGAIAVLLIVSLPVQLGIKIKERFK